MSVTRRSFNKFAASFPIIPILPKQKKQKIYVIEYIHELGSHKVPFEAYDNETKAIKRLQKLMKLKLKGLPIKYSIRETYIDSYKKDSNLFYFIKYGEDGEYSNIHTDIYLNKEKTPRKSFSCKSTKSGYTTNNRYYFSYEIPRDITVLTLSGKVTSTISYISEEKAIKMLVKNNELV